MTVIKDWKLDKLGHAVVTREARYWRPAKGRSVICDLCYRACVIEPGQAGWCKSRVNRSGRLVLSSHGVLSSLALQMRGYQVDPFMTYKPGALSLFVGGTHCTSGCVFCMSKEITWRPDRIPWGYGERKLAQGLFFTHRAMVHPKAVIWTAQYLGCSQIEFGINEPLMTYEYTLDTARLAKAAGLEVVIETNGFSSTAAIRELAPYIDAVDLGIKGSADPAFYAKWMKAPGSSVEAVKESALEWRRAGVHLIIGDVIAPSHMQSEEAFNQSVRDFYQWIYDNLGALTEVLITTLNIPGPASSQASDDDRLFLPPTATRLDKEIYQAKINWAICAAHKIGLPYAHNKTALEPILCHACKGELLVFKTPEVYCFPCTMPMQFCDQWDTTSYVTAGHCDHCGAQVPIVSQTAEEREKSLAALRSFPDEPRYKGKQTFLPA